MITVNNDLYNVVFDESKDYFVYEAFFNRKAIKLKLPVFEINSKKVKAGLYGLKKISDAVKYKNGVEEYKIQGSIEGLDGANLTITLRLAPGSPILRFKYDLTCGGEIFLTKSSGSDNLTYLGISGDVGCEYREIRISDFNEMVHSFCLVENKIDEKHFINGCGFFGPIFLKTNSTYTEILAYEHGSQVPDRFIEFKLNNNYEIELRAVKGNYFSMQAVSDEKPFESIWLQYGACPGGENSMAVFYRDFVLRYLSLNTESRKPYIFYNTWAFQERNKWWNGRSYSNSMCDERILKEIETAHEIGIEVFVLDTGWFEKTGDWAVDSQKFSNRLKTVKNLLDKYGMKLGLWFDPQSAAVSSKILKNNRECTIKDSNGKELGPYPARETEDSYRMCLASRYYKDFALELIRLAKDLGVVYFKWDAIHQYGCCGSGHYHGGQANTVQERSDCYAFQIGRYMSKTVDMLCSECPDAIVDFDITEGQRYVGLGFLSSGKYFLINNGPYYANYNIPRSKAEWSNVFVYPGPARPWICRTPLSFDKWIPSVLFLTHYLPDDPESSQTINMASMILGQNGIWGDLLNISEAGVKHMSHLISLYKKVRDDITASYPIITGTPGCSPEIYEKINSAGGKGVIVVFANNRGRYTYISTNTVNKKYWCNEGVGVEFDPQGRAVIDCDFKSPDAKIIFFGV